MLVNVNKLKPYKYMEFEVQKQEQQMLSVLGATCKWTSKGRLWYRHGIWKLCKITTTNMRQWKRRTNGRFWSQKNIDFKTLDDKTIVE